MNTKFEWEPRKAIAILAKHAVSFDMATKAFADPFAIEFEDRRFDYGEDRFLLIGMMTQRLIVVAFTQRAEHIRIIFARGAVAFEQRLYHERRETF